MKVLLINGSPHKKGCTFVALNEISKILNNYNIKSEIIHIGKKSIHPCTACMKCKKTGKCKYGGIPNKILNKIKKNDAVILGSPVCYGGPTGALCVILDRVCFSVIPKDLNGKIGMNIIVTHYKDIGSSLNRLNQYFLSTNLKLIETSKENIFNVHKVKDIKVDKNLNQLNEIAQVLVDSFNV
jgi:multimeric flavodoxin WrbA